MKWEGTKYLWSEGKGENTPLPNNEGKKSANDAGPRHGHDTPVSRLLWAWVIGK